MRLVAGNPVYFPLGFAYGHLPGHAVSFADQMGRGFAAQQLLEELAARKELSAKVRPAPQQPAVLLLLRVPGGCTLGCSSHPRRRGDAAMSLATCHATGTAAAHVMQFGQLMC